MLLLITILSFSDYFKLTATPLDFQKDDDSTTYVNGSRGIYGQGGQLLFLPEGDPSVLFIQPETRAVQRIGGRGDGPGEFGFWNPKALSPGSGTLWVLDHKNRALFYADGKFQTSFQIKSYQISANSRPKYAFAHNELFVVIPSYPASMALANVYDYSGQIVQKLGEIFPVDPEMLQWNPAVNNTIWSHYGGNWYCLFTYRPVIRIFNAQFELKKELRIVGPEVDFFEEIFHKMESDPNFPEIRPHFTDFQVTQKHIYVMCKGVLYQMDHGANVLSRTGFYGNKEAFELVGYYPLVGFPHAVVMPGGRIYLGTNGDYLGHDLWYVDARHLGE